MKQRSLSAFSLIELTLAIGIAAFCLLAVMGLIPIAVLTNRNTTSQTAATNIVAAVVADLRATPLTVPPGRATTSVQYQIPIPPKPRHCVDDHSPGLLCSGRDIFPQEQRSCPRDINLTVTFSPPNGPATHNPHLCRC